MIFHPSQVIATILGTAGDEGTKANITSMWVEAEAQSAAIRLNRRLHEIRQIAKTQGVSIRSNQIVDIAKASFKLEMDAPFMTEPPTDPYPITTLPPRKIKRDGPPIS